MTEPAVTATVNAERQVATITLRRPEVHNAFDDVMIRQLTEAVIAVGEEPRARVLVLAAQGKSFSAGGDLNWMRRMAGYSDEENLADAEALAWLMMKLDRCPKPTIARVQGSAFGGGVGLVAACDLAVTVEGAQFSLSEVRLGLMPSVVGPYVVRAIGERQARRYFLTAERISAAEAHRIGLVHEVVAADRLDAAVDRLIEALVQGGPVALTEAKQLARYLADRPIDEIVIPETARRIADLRASPEGREGVQAFLDKRKPAWIK